MISANRVCSVVFLVLGSVSACSDGDDASSGSGQSVWAPTTVPFDPSCKDCKEIGTAQLPHMGETRLLVDTRVDDPEAQWSRCVNGLLDCIEEGKGESACVAGSTCPGPCKADYKARLEKLGEPDLTARWNAIRAVFVTPISRCALPASSSSEAAP